MPDRILRVGVWESDRYLSLQTDTAKLAFFRCMGFADDFGNFEAGRYLHRAMVACTHIKTEEETAGIFEALVSADLLRAYNVDIGGEPRQFWHMPRFRSHRQYVARHVPPSPWCDPNAALGKNKRVNNKGLAGELVDTCLLHSSNVAEGVGVGVGVGVGENQEKSNTTADGADAPLSSSKSKYKRKKPIQIPLPDHFERMEPSPRIIKYCEDRGIKQLKAHMVNFVGWAVAKGAMYADWDQALMNAIRGDWAKLNHLENHS